MIRKTIGLVIALLCMFDTSTCEAQAELKVEDTAQVYFERILVTFPVPYLHVRKPDPPVPGFYAWRLSFGGQRDLTVVLRADTVLRSSDSRTVVRASSLRRCPANAESVLDCITPMAGTARVSGNDIILEITEPAFVALVRERQPHAIVRHIFEPGGRFRVNHIGIRYRWLPHAAPRDTALHSP